MMMMMMMRFHFDSTALRLPDDLRRRKTDVFIFAAVVEQKSNCIVES